MTLKQFVAGAALVAVMAPALILVVGGADEGSSCARESAQAALPAVQRRPAAAPVRRGLRMPTTLSRSVGHEVTYRVSLSGQLNSVDEGGSRSLLQLAGRGELVSTCYRANESGLRVGERLRFETFDVAGLDPAEAKVLRADLARGVEVVLDLNPQGTIQRLALLGASGPATRNLLRSWAGSTHFVLPALPESSEWDALGYDSTGRCRDAYVVVGEAVDGPQVRRARRFVAKEGEPLPQHSGGLVGVIQPTGLLAHLEGEEVIRIQGAGPTLVYRARHGLAYVGERQLDAAEVARRAAVCHDAAWEDDAETDTTSKRSPEVLSLEDALALVARDVKQGFFPLRDLLRRDASAAALVALRIQDASTPVETRRHLVDTLAAAETPATQSALLSLARAELPNELVPNVYLGLGQASEPLPQVVGFLLESLEGEESVRTGWAVQAAGFAAGQAREPEIQETLVLGLEQVLGGQRDALILNALGNAGLQRSGQAVSDYVREGEVEHRREAVFALRKLASVEARSVIHAALSDDPAETVRCEALRAMAFRAPSANLTALVRALQEDAHELVRLEAVRTLKSWLNEGEAELAHEVRQDVVGALATAATDPSRIVREAALESAS
jgi:hypothetical protein